MRKLLLIIAFIFLVLGIVLLFLPLYKLSVWPLGIAFISSGLAFIASRVERKRIPKMVVLFTIVTLLVAVSRMVFTHDKVVDTLKIDKIEEQSQQEDIQDLEGLDNDTKGL